jgi:hypothetical protein
MGIVKSQPFQMNEKTTAPAAKVANVRSDTDKGIH